MNCCGCKNTSEPTTVNEREREEGNIQWLEEIYVKEQSKVKGVVVTNYQTERNN